MGGSRGERGEGETEVGEEGKEFVAAGREEVGVPFLFYSATAAVIGGFRVVFVLEGS